MTISQTYRQIIEHKDLRKRILYTLILLFLSRVLAHVPLPGVDFEALRRFFQQSQLFGLLDLFSGGSISRFSIILMGVGPYITASIIMQLLQMVIPQLDALAKEGEFGRKKINQYTRYLTVPMALVQSYGMIVLLRNQQVISTSSWGSQGWLSVLVVSAAGTILLMWLGELISENGIGNGISLLITIGIIAGIPTQIRNTLAVLDATRMIGLAFFGVIGLLVVALIIFITEGQREVPISYARLSRGNLSPGNVDTYLPIRVNLAGVIPIIFAISIMLFPGVIARFFQAARSPWLANFAQKVEQLFTNNLFYGICYFILVVLFTYFYIAIIFQPKEVAENLQKRGGFVPGIRPGVETANYLGYVLNRVTLVGAIFLGLVAVMPFIVQSLTKITTLALGGTGLLIVVTVIIETTRQVQAQLAMRSYEDY